MGDPKRCPKSRTVSVVALKKRIEDLEGEAYAFQEGAEEWKARALAAERGHRPEAPVDHSKCDAACSLECDLANRGPGEATPVDEDSDGGAEVALAARTVLAQRDGRNEREREALEAELRAQRTAARLRQIGGILGNIDEETMLYRSARDSLARISGIMGNTNGDPEITASLVAKMVADYADGLGLDDAEIQPVPATPTPSYDPCDVDIVMSCMCIYGTKSCVAEHTGNRSAPRPSVVLMHLAAPNVGAGANRCATTGGNRTHFRADVTCEKCLAAEGWQGLGASTVSSGAATHADDLRDADLDRMTARECFEFLSRGLEGGEAAILKAVAMTRAHERRKRR